MTAIRQDILNQAPCGIFSFTEDGVITIANAYCYEMLEYATGELTGTNISGLLSVSGRIFYQTHFYPLIKLHNHFEEIFLNLQTKSKKDIPVVMNAVAIQTDDAPEILCSFIPVFNRRKYEDGILLAKKSAEEAMHENKALEKIKQELEEQQIAMDKHISLLKFQNKELIQLSDIITHDLQEPVRKLILFSKALLDEATDTRVKNYALSVIQRSSQKIKNLLYNLQKYLSLTGADRVIDKVSLEGLVQQELQDLKVMYPQIKVDSTCDDLPIISGDRKQLAQMIHHLLKNAFDHGSVDSHLTLQIQAVVIKENVFSSVENKYKYVEYLKLIIKDNGPGFNAQYEDYIFSVLKRLDISGSTAGFGLAFCKRIAENHLGSIKATGGAGTGAAFTILLPVNNAF